MHPRETARLYSDKPAFIMAGSGAIVTYGALAKRANRAGRLLRSLGLRRGDQIAYELSGDQVVLRRSVTDDVEDPALLGFLDLLERDIADHPERLHPCRLT